MIIDALNPAFRQEPKLSRVVLQEHTKLGVPEIYAGKTKKGTYFYKEIHPKPFKYAYTVLLKPDGTEIIARDNGKKLVMTKSKKGIVSDEIFFERVKDGKVNVTHDNEMIGKRKLLPKRILRIFKRFDPQKSSIFTKFFSCAKKSVAI